MHALSSVDLKYVMQELRPLVSGRIDKIYHPKKEELLIQFFVSGKGKHLLKVIVGKFIFLSEIKDEQEDPSGFCMFLRKYLTNARLLSIEQMGSERIVRLVLETKEKTFELYIELFGQGNIILTDDRQIIVNCLEQKKWADREIKKGVAYVFPMREYDALALEEKAFARRLESEKEVVLRLAKDIGLGGVYAEEICLLADVDKKKDKLTEFDVRKLFAAYRKVMEHQIDAQIILKNETPSEATPFPFVQMKEYAKKKAESFSQALDLVFRETEGKDEFISKHEEAIVRASRIVEDQEKNIEALEKQAAEENKKGELIYANYQVISDVLKQINDARKKLSFEDMKAKLKGHKMVKSLDGKEKKVTIELS